MNIIDDRGADPWIIKEGDYFYCKSMEWDTEIAVATSKTLQGIGQAALKTVASEQTLPSEVSKQIWAPELHRMGDKWYIYFASSDGNNENHRMHVIRSASSDPMSDYEYVGKIGVEDDRWAIDGTVLKVHDRQYFVWSGWEGDEDGQQNLYIAQMTSPTTLEATRTCISMPQNEWEKNGMPINEGPAALYHDNDVFLAFSASSSLTDDYCIGLLRLKGDDPRDITAWEKSEMPMYKGHDEEFGPGHCSFTTDEQGNDVIIYHTARFSGSGWDRQIRHAPVVWKNGYPTIGKAGNQLLMHDNDELENTTLVTE